VKEGPRRDREPGTRRVLPTVRTRAGRALPRPRTGLRAIIAIHSTTLGPALGGTRFYPYPDEDAALDDVLDLSRAMAYKAALAGLDLGGGKAVIIGDPRTDKTEALLRAYGRFVQSLGGRYRTACDVGTFSEDMDVIARECDFVTGRTSRTAAPATPRS
jgi:valine dehydrogenase (NAD+)